MPAVSHHYKGNNNRAEIPDNYLHIYPKKECHLADGELLVRFRAGQYAEKPFAFVEHIRLVSRQRYNLVKLLIATFSGGFFYGPNHVYQGAFTLKNMHFVAFGEWWEDQGLVQQLFWLIAIVSSILMAILTGLSLYEMEQPAPAERQSLLARIFAPRLLLSFATAFGWLAVILSYQDVSLHFILILSAAAGLAMAMLSKLLVRILLHFIPHAKPFKAEQLMERTGKVLEPIPSHRNGFGKVHLNLRDAPYELEAITAGGELPPGASIRVVGVIDGRVLLVEPIENGGYPHEQQWSTRG